MSDTGSRSYILTDWRASGGINARYNFWRVYVGILHRGQYRDPVPNSPLSTGKIGSAGAQSGWFRV